MTAKKYQVRWRLAWMDCADRQESLKMKQMFCAPKAQHMMLSHEVSRQSVGEEPEVNVASHQKNVGGDGFVTTSETTCLDCIYAGFLGRWVCALPPRIGAYSNAGWTFYRDANAFIENGSVREKVLREFSMVEPWWCLRNAVHDVPQQVNGWSCGINGSARFMAMLGKPVADYREYHDRAPNYAAFHTEVGPGPRHLHEYMSKDHHLVGIYVGVNKTSGWASQKKWIDESIQLRRPILVLLEVQDRMLHYANIVGRRWNHPHDYLLLNSDDRLYVMSEADLQQRMDLSEHMSQHPVGSWNPIVSFEQLSRYNSISCTWGNLPEGHGDIRTFGGHGVQLRGDRNAAHNIANTVLNSPIVRSTYVGWIWRIT